MNYIEDPGEYYSPGAYNDEFYPLKCCACGATIGNAADPYADPSCRYCAKDAELAEYEAGE
jgi:hypothetical protein